MPNLTTIETAMNAIIPQVDPADAIRANLETVTTAQATAAAAMTAAEVAGDAAAYATAKAERKAAEDMAKIYAGQLKAAKPVTKIKAEDYQTFLTQIMTELDALTATAKAAADPLIVQVNTITADLKTQIDQGNALLHTLQTDLYRDSIEQAYPDGSRVEIHGLHKSYENTLPAYIKSELE